MAGGLEVGDLVVEQWTDCEATAEKNNTVLASLNVPVECSKLSHGTDVSEKNVPMKNFSGGKNSLLVRFLCATGVLVPLIWGDWPRRRTMGSFWVPFVILLPNPV